MVRPAMGPSKNPDSPSRWQGLRRVLGAVSAAALLAVPSARAEAPAPSGPASTEEAKREVRRLVREAGQLMDRGDHAGAIERLLHARRLQADPTLDYNLGVAYAESSQPAQAARSFQLFLQQADTGAVLAERIEDARQRLAVYQRSLSRLAVQAAVPAGALAPSLCLDQAPCVPLPASPGPADGEGAVHWLAPGSHSVRVTATGARDYLVQVELKPGELRKLSGDLRLLGDTRAELVPSTPEARRAAEQPSTPLYKKWWLWTAVGGGAVALVAVVAAGASGSMTRVAPGSDLDPVDVSR